MHVRRKNSLRDVMADRCDRWIDGWMDGSSSLNSGRSGEVVVVVLDLDARRCRSRSTWFGGLVVMVLGVEIRRSRSTWFGAWCANCEKGMCGIKRVWLLNTVRAGRSCFVSNFNSVTMQPDDRLFWFFGLVNECGATESFPCGAVGLKRPTAEP